MLNFKVNETLCVKCGKCVADCPAQCIVMEEGNYPCIPAEEMCLRCQHCLAICPTAAISILDVDPEQSQNITELPTPESLERLIKGRRSTRSYKKQDLPKETIEQLLATAWHAPTAANAQSVLFTATTSLAATEALGKEIYAKLGKMLDGMAPDEGDLRHQSLRMAYDAYSQHGVDIVLRGAPHILIASAPKNVAAPKEDCLIALTTFELLAQSSGVGTLWGGILKWCLVDFFPELAIKLGVPEDHEFGYCMAFGLPAVQYQRTVQRGPAGMNLVDTF